jgi:hypothetical protein
MPGPGKRFVKGDPRAGRPRGSLNKVTRAAKEFLSDLVDDPDIQAAVRERVLAGDTMGFFKALEMVHGKPHQSMDVSMSDRKMVNWPIRVATDADLEEQELVEVEGEP